MSIWCPKYSKIQRHLPVFKRSIGSNNSNPSLPISIKKVPRLKLVNCQSYKIVFSRTIKVGQKCNSCTEIRINLHNLTFWDNVCHKGRMKWTAFVLKDGMHARQNFKHLNISYFMFKRKSRLRCRISLFLGLNFSFNKK